jgi:hypothetical protein
LNEGFELARQALYHLSHTASFFCSVILEIEFHFLSGIAWTTILLFMLSVVAGMTGMYHYTQPLVEMGVFLFPLLFYHLMR